MAMPDKERINDKLRKLLVLSEEGFGGERNAAKKQLDKLLAKYNISLSDISDQHIDKIEYKYHTHWGLKMMLSLHSKITKDRSKFYSKNPRFKIIWLGMTKLEEAEFNYLWGIYKQEYKKFERDQKEIMYLSFVSKNKIFHPSEPDEDRELTDEQKLKLLKIGQMTFTMERIKTNKALNH